MRTIGHGEVNLVTSLGGAVRAFERDSQLF